MFMYLVAVKVIVDPICRNVFHKYFSVLLLIALRVEIHNAGNLICWFILFWAFQQEVSPFCSVREIFSP